MRLTRARPDLGKYGGAGRVTCQGVAHDSISKAASPLTVTLHTCFGLAGLAGLMANFGLRGGSSQSGRVETVKHYSYLCTFSYGKRR